MKRIIKDITTIQTGLFAKPGGTGDTVYLQARHFDEDGKLVNSLHPDLKVSNIAGKHLLKPGDVLFAAKGSKNFATVYEEHNPPAVASTSFFVLRLSGTEVLPEYLAWLLNSFSVQSILKAQAIGSSIPSLSKQVLENLEVSIPSIEIQRAILNITLLRNKEKELHQRITTLKEFQIQQYIFNAIK